MISRRVVGHHVSHRSALRHGPRPAAHQGRVPEKDGSFRITGEKIFISAGEHDLSDNIVHLVLARLPDAPPGTKGISLFIVPKFLPAADGGVGERNGVKCASIEHKMGIKASATAVLVFEDAKGYIVGEPHKGLRCMFTMMNVARLGTGMQGYAQSEASFQGALAYARDRLQMRSLTGPNTRMTNPSPEAAECAPEYNAVRIAASTTWSSGWIFASTLVPTRSSGVQPRAAAMFGATQTICPPGRTSTVKSEVPSATIR